MSEKLITVEQIMDMLPHRYPMLLVDRILHYEADKVVEGLKNVTFNEPFFQGHFPNKPVMPGVLIIEAMAQTAGALVLTSLGDDAKGKLVYFMSVEEARFRKPVVPGDQLHIRADKIQNRRNVWKFAAQAKVDDVIVADAKFTAMII